MRIYAASDIHTDYKQNMEWCAALVQCAGIQLQHVLLLSAAATTCSRLEQHCATEEHFEDVIIVAGDVSDDIQVFRRTFELLTSAYAHVFFTAGNHEM
jgi:3',5'-cyclic AMP phosphodiesterase CpdA